MWNKKQFQTVTLPILLLQLLAEEDHSGLQLVYQIREKTNGSYSAGLGSLFAFLHPMEEGGYISSNYPNGRTRYYHIEAEGHRYLSTMLGEYYLMDKNLQHALSNAKVS